MSQSRQRLSELTELDTLTEDQGNERDSLVAEYPELEKRYQGAIIAESVHPVNDAESREHNRLETRASIGNYIDAMLSGGDLDGAESELNQSMGLQTRSGGGGVIMPMSMLAPQVETRANETTDISSSTKLPATGTPWLTRLFAESWLSWSGVTMREASGEMVHTKITGGASASSVAKGAEVETDAMTIDTTLATPRRVSAAYRCSGVDELRTKGKLAQAIQSDLRRVIVDKVENLVINGVVATDGFNGLNAAYTADPDAAKTTDTTGSNFDALMGRSIDGIYATMWNDLKVLMNPSFYASMSSYLTTGGDYFWIAEWKRRGVDFRSTAHIKEIGTTGDDVGDSYIYAFGGRGIAGALVLDAWGGVELMRDPYSNLRSDQIDLVGKTYVQFSIVRDGHVKKHRVAIS